MRRLHQSFMDTEEKVVNAKLVIEDLIILLEKLRDCADAEIDVGRSGREISAESFELLKVQHAIAQVAATSCDLHANLLAAVGLRPGTRLTSSPGSPFQRYGKHSKESA